MKKTQLEKLHNLLLQQQKDLMNQLEINIFDLGNIQNDNDADWFDKASLDHSKNDLILIKGDLIQDLEDISISLRKIDKSVYGLCENCKQKIPFTRLEVLPSVKFCISCMNEVEKQKNKHTHRREQKLIPGTAYAWLG